MLAQHMFPPNTNSDPWAESEVIRESLDVAPQQTKKHFSYYWDCNQDLKTVETDKAKLKQKLLDSRYWIVKNLSNFPIYLKIYQQLTSALHLTNFFKESGEIFFLKNIYYFWKNKQAYVIKNTIL